MSKSKLYSSDKVIEEFYKALADKNESKVRRVHIPRSDVFYIREKIHQDTGIRYSLDRVERAMYLEGHLSRYDVLDPDRKRKWEE
jgi:hypothetical protein|tara:strand:+ start:188 stop:442 length:255 start_codon:yes stop_codon:yes gene_type:complete